MSSSGVGIMKKPLNMLQNPVLPDIRQGPPIFQWTGKHWNVDVGKVLIETEHSPQLVESSILVQSRDYNKQTAYGRSSHKDVVNENFRPPLIDPIVDLQPLSRLKHPQSFVRLNPGTPHAGFTSELQDNQSFKNLRKASKDGKATSRPSRPTFFRPLNLVEDNSVLPDLEIKLPSASASAGFRGPNIDAPHREVELEEVHPSASVFAGYTPSMTSTMTEQYEGGVPVLDDVHLSTSVSAGHSNPYRTGVTPIDFELDEKSPSVSVTAGKDYRYREGLTPIDVELEEKAPSVSASAGYASNFKTGVTPIEHLLEQRNPSVSVSAGHSSNYRAGVTPIDHLLEEKNPSVSVTAGVSPNYAYRHEDVHYDLESKTSAGAVSAGMNTPYQARGETRIDEVRGDKIHPTVYVRPEIGYRERNGQLADGTVRYDEKREAISYALPTENPFKSTNVSTHRPGFQYKAAGNAGVTQGMKNQGYIPRAGVAMGQVMLRDKANPKLDARPSK